MAIQDHVQFRSCPFGILSIRVVNIIISILTLKSLTIDRMSYNNYNMLNVKYYFLRKNEWCNISVVSIAYNNLHEGNKLYGFETQHQHFTMTA